MKIFVSGGTGFIGQHLVRRLLKDGNSVVCLVRNKERAKALKALGAELLAGTLLYPDSWSKCLRDVNVIYNIAGVTRARKTSEYYEGNLHGTRSLVSAARHFCVGLERFVHLSSLAAVGPQLNGIQQDEDSPFHPVSHYGRSKMLGEQEVWSARSDIPITIVRPGAVYGPADEAFLEYFKLVSRGLLLLIGWKTKLLNVVHVDDLVKGILKAASARVAIGERYFLGDTEARSIEEVGETIAKVIGVKVRKIRLPYQLVLTYAAVSELIGKISGKPVFSNIQKVQEGVQPIWTCSVEKAKTQLGYEPRIALQDGMKQTYQWYVDHEWIESRSLIIKNGTELACR
jgi:nucleoside-diphosphate-sugar epimerase